jgi:hypothetical protein
VEIKTITKEIRALALEMNIEFEELVEWLIRENNNTLPWEE